LISSSGGEYGTTKSLFLFSNSNNFPSQKSITSSLNEDSKERLDSIQKEIELYKTRQELVHQQANAVRAEIATIKAKKTLTDEDKKKATIVLTAYKQAQKAGESKAFLEEMNLEFAKEYGFKVYTDKGTGSPFVADLEGNKVL
jgi:septal ring factor EnvC (AmiA/AmiB activator)